MIDKLKESLENCNKKNNLSNTQEQLESVFVGNKVDIQAHHSEIEKRFRSDMQKWLDKNLIDKDPFGLGIIKSFSFFKAGETSIVVKLETENNEGFVFKTRSSDGGIIEAEAEGFKRWGKQGADVIEIIKEGELDLNGAKQPYIILPLMSHEYILDQANRPIVCGKIGKNLAKMHREKGEGFGHVIKNNEGNFVGEEKEYKLSSSIKDNISFLAEHKIFDKDRLGKLVNKSYQMVKEDIDNGTDLVWTHGDINPSNMFLTGENGITIFDSEPKIEHPMRDLGLTIIKNTNKINDQKEKKLLEESIIEGYKNEGGEINKKIMDAALFLACIKKAVRNYSRGVQYKEQGNIDKANEFFARSHFMDKLLELAPKIEKY